MPDLTKDWPVLVLVGGVLYFFAYVVVKGRQEERKNKKEGHDR